VQGIPWFAHHASLDMLLSNEHGWAILTCLYGFWGTSPNPFYMCTLVIANVLLLPPTTYLVGAQQGSVMLSEMCCYDCLLEITDKKQRSNWFNCN